MNEMRNGDWPAERAPILISFQDIARGSIDLVEKCVGVERVVAQKFKRASMPLVGAGLGNHADNSAAVPAILRRIVTFEDPEFSNGVGIGIEHDAVVEQIVVQSSVQQISHGVGAAASNAEISSAPVVVVGFGHTRLKQGEVQGI